MMIAFKKRLKLIPICLIVAAAMFMTMQVAYAAEVPVNFDTIVSPEGGWNLTVESYEWGHAYTMKTSIISGYDTMTISIPDGKGGYTKTSYQIPKWTTLETPIPAMLKSASRLYPQDADFTLRSVNSTYASNTGWTEWAWDGSYGPYTEPADRGSEPTISTEFTRIGLTAKNPADNGSNTTNPYAGYLFQPTPIRFRIPIPEGLRENDILTFKGNLYDALVISEANGTQNVIKTGVTLFINGAEVTPQSTSTSSDWATTVYNMEYTVPMGGITSMEVQFNNHLSITDPENKTITGVHLYLKSSRGFFHAGAIDSNPPSVSVTSSKEGWTNQDVTLTIAASDSESGLAAQPYSWDNGVSWGTNASKSFSSNQTVNIKVRDAAGNTTSKSVVIGNIDKDAPSFSNVSGASTAWGTSRTISINGAGDALSGLADAAYYFNGKWQSSNTFTYTGTKKTDTIGVRDRAGNEYTKTVNVYVDTTAPAGASVSGENTSWATNRTITINGAYDNDSQLNAAGAYFFNGQWQTSNSYNYTSTMATDIVKVRDNTGNVWSATINVFVDATKPTGVTVNGESDSWATSRTITINGATDAHSGLTSPAYFFNGQWQSSNSYTYTGTLERDTIMVRDAVGNTYSKDISVHVDSSAPTGAVISGDAAGNDWALSRTITIVNAVDLNVGLHEKAYYFNGQWQSEPSYTYTETKTTDLIKVRDKLGNEVSYPVNVYVDRTNPVVLSITGESTEWGTSRKITITSAQDAESGLHTTAYFFNGMWRSSNTYTYTNTITEDTIKVRDALGNEYVYEARIYVDKTSPTVTITGQSSTYNRSRMITVVASDLDSGLPTTAYSYDGGNTWENNYTHVYTDTIREATIMVRDSMNNISTQTINVYVDTSAPTVSIFGESTTFAKSRQITLAAEDMNVGMPDAPYSFDGGITWQSSNEFTFTSTTEKATVVVRDKLDNRFIKEINVYVDTSAPEATVFNESTTYARSRTIFINATDSPGVGLANEPYSFDGGTTWQSSNTYTYTTTTTRPTVIVKDKLNNRFTKVIDVFVDVDAPAVAVTGDSTTYQRSKTITISASDDNSGLHNRAYSFDNGVTWQDTPSFTYNQTTVRQTIQVRDQLENITTKQIDVYVDATPPTMTVSGESTIWASHRTITINEGYDANAGLHPTAPYSFDDGESWQASPSYDYTTTTQTATVCIRDALGNKFSKEVNVYVDTLGPELHVEYLRLSNDRRSVLTQLVGEDNSCPSDELLYCFDYNTSDPASTVWQRTSSQMMRLGVEKTVGCMDNLGNITVQTITPTIEDTVERATIINDMSLFELQGYTLGNNHSYLDSAGIKHAYQTYSVNGAAAKELLKVSFSAEPSRGGVIVAYAKLSNELELPVYWDDMYTTLATSEEATGSFFIDPSLFTVSKKFTSLTIYVAEYTDDTLTTKLKTDSLNAVYNIDVTPPTARISYNSENNTAAITVTDNMSPIASTQYYLTLEDGTETLPADYTGMMSLPDDVANLHVITKDAVDNEGITSSIRLIHGSSSVAAIPSLDGEYPSFRSQSFDYYYRGIK